MGNVHPATQVALTALISLLAACSHTIYVDRNDGHQSESTLNPFERVVQYDVDLGMVIPSPGCTAVGPVSIDPQSPPTLGIDIYDLLRRSLLVQARMNLPDQEIIEIVTDKDQAVFEARIQGCTFLLMANLIVQDEAYFLIWSRKRIGITVQLVRLEDNQSVWSAQHTASRSEGGIPLSPLGAITTILRAKDFAEDKDVLPSIIDDALRRIFATFPAQALMRNNDAWTL